MSYVKKSIRGIWATMISVVVTGAIAAWQFYLFATFKGSAGVLDVQGGRGHLWVAILATVFACFAAFCVFSVFLRYDRDDEIHITSVDR
ncbi:MAG: hypothetical protein ABR555_19685 [Pyrinomonadaceae bacterium]